MTENTFYGLGIAPGLIDVINSLKFTVPTPIQHKAIPPAIEGKDIIGIAQTGTGKTLAFGIPMVQKIAASNGKRKGLILVPTRELAIQVNETMVKLAKPFRMTTSVLIGGESMFTQLLSLRQRPSIIIATPGRLNDHLQQRKVRIDDVAVLVLDEADRMLDMGFLPQIRNILDTTPKDRQTMLFSATIPKSVISIATQYMRMPLTTEIAPSGTAPEIVSQEMFVVKKESKNHVLGELLKLYKGSILLFVRTRWAAARVAKQIRSMGHAVAEIHSDRNLSQRKDALRGFKTGQYRVLVATDIAARGIDVTGIELVINYDLPDDPENYVHRIGRTGRAGVEGHAITLATPDQGRDIKKIQSILKVTIPVAEHPSVQSQKFIPTPSGTRSFFPPGKRKGARRPIFS